VSASTKKQINCNQSQWKPSVAALSGLKSTKCPRVDFISENKQVATNGPLLRSLAGH